MTAGAARFNGLINRRELFRDRRPAPGEKSVRSVQARRAQSYYIARYASVVIYLAVTIVRTFTLK